ncbi:nuclear GTPase SLIP-GC-like [Aplochiton taeniatus]
MEKKISAAETNKQELVGVFGKTGAGKSSLINAVLGEKDLLPSGGITACTSVVVKVEANMINSKYMAEIEFITKELLGSVSAVWIVSDTNRAASEKEPWEILNSTISLMGNGGECRSISFICSKSDLIEDPP